MSRQDTNKISIELFSQLIRKSWTKETCYEPWQNTWSERLPSFGQCYVTARLFQHYFGGAIMKAKDSKGSSHYWNVLDNKTFDFTRDQYSPTEIFTHIQPTIETSDNIRLHILKDRFESHRLKILT